MIGRLVGNEYIKISRCRPVWLRIFTKWLETRRPFGEASGGQKKGSKPDTLGLGAPIRFTVGTDGTIGELIT